MKKLKPISHLEPRLSFITLGVSNLKRSRAFYEKGLGLKPSKASKGDIVFFQMGDMVLALYSHHLLAEDAGVHSKGGGFRGVTVSYNVRKKEDVAGILKLAKSSGGKIVKPAQDVFWGGHSGYFADPDGHLWEVAWNPFFKLNKKGAVHLP